MRESRSAWPTPPGRMTVFRSPRVWLYAAGSWLIVTAVAHSGGHVWTFVLENGLVGQREFAMNAMKQALSSDPLQPSMWRLLRMFSVSFSLFLIFGGAITVMLTWMAAPLRLLRSVALFCTVFWTVAFGLYVFVDPVIQPILIAGVAVPLYAIAWVTANAELEVGAPEDLSG